MRIFGKGAVIVILYLVVKELCVEYELLPLRILSFLNVFFLTPVLHPSSENSSSFLKLRGTEFE